MRTTLGAVIFLVAAQWTMNNVKVFEFQERWMASSEAVTVDNFVNRGDVETAIVLGHDHKHENGRTTLNARVDAVARIGAGLKTIIMSGGMGEAEAMKERLENKKKKVGKWAKPRSTENWAKPNP